MATNITRYLDEAFQLAVACSNPTTPVSGDPVRVGALTGIALTDEGEGGNAATDATVNFGRFVAEFSVKGVDDSGNSAVAKYDELFYVDADTPKLSKKSSGYFFGYAWATVNSGATATIEVLHVPSPGAGTLGTGTVGSTQLATGAVTAAKLSSTLKAGHIALRITEAREIATNDIINTAGDAGVLSSNTTPILQRVNGATDKKLRLNWASSNNDEIVWDFVYPADLDDTAAVVVHVLAAMSGATNTPVLAISYFEGLGDTNAGGNTAAVTGTSIAEYTVTIAAGDVGAAPNAASIGIVPGAHTTDALYIYAVWVTYTRK